MAYKDKQKQAVRAATRRYRLRKQGITKQATEVIPCDTRDTTKPVIPVIPEPLDLLRLLDPSILDEFKPAPVEAQSHSPMMVGYVPPQEGE